MCSGSSACTLHAAPAFSFSILPLCFLVRMHDLPSAVQVLFRMCSERPRTPLLDLGSPLGRLLSSTSSYDVLRDATAAVADELHERTLMARLGI